MAHHGQTPAAWTGMGTSLLGFVIGGVALLLDPISLTLFWIGLALAIIGFPLWWLMAKMGMG